MMQLIVTTPLGVIKGKKEDYDQKNFIAMIDYIADAEAISHIKIATEDGLVILHKDIISNSVFQLFR
jgi:hypothetical protein